MPSSILKICLIAAAAAIASLGAARAQSCAKVAAWERAGAPILSTKGPTSTLKSYAEIVPLYNSPAFIDMAGRPFAQLSYRRRVKIGQQVSKCSKNSFLRALATYPLFDQDGSDNHREMLALLADAPPAEAAMAAATAARDQQAQQMADAKAWMDAKRAREAQPRRPVPHRAGEKIFENDAVAVFHERTSTHDAPRPQRCRGVPRLSLVFKESVRDRAAMTDDGVGPLLRDAVIPAAMAQCPNPDRRIRASVFFEGVHLASGLRRRRPYGEEISAADVAGGVDEAPFGVIDASAKAGFRMDFRSSYQKPSGDGWYATPQELATLAGFREARARGFLGKARFAENESLAAAQRALLGHTVDDLALWSAIKGEDYTIRGIDLRSAAQRDHVHYMAQTYGQATVGHCGNAAPGGFYLREFKLLDPDTKEPTDVFPTRLLNDLGDAGHQIPANGLQVNTLGLLFADVPIFDPYVKEGPLRQELNAYVKRHGCASPLLRRLHDNIVSLVTHHGLK